MKKIIKKTGNSLCIIINSEDAKIYELKEGDVVEIAIRKDRQEHAEFKGRFEN